MKYGILLLGCEAEQEAERYFEDAFEVYRKSESVLSEEEKKEYKYIINFDLEKEMDGGIIPIQSIRDSKYTPIFKWFFDRGFRTIGEKANALFVCYILERPYCYCMYDFWNLYEAVFELEHFSKKVELWDAKYKLYEDLKQRLLEELDKNILWK